MPSEFELLQVLGVIMLGTYGFAAFTAFRIRSTLGAGDYRRQALGIGLLAIVFAAWAAVFVLNLWEQGTGGVVIGVTFMILAYVTLFYWVDSSAIAAKRTDPLYRDSLRWNSIRRVLWLAMTLATVTFFAELAYLILIVGTPLEPQATPLPVLGAIVVVIFGTLISGCSVLPVSLRRSKDTTLRKQLEWLFLFIAIQLVFAIYAIGLAYNNPSIDVPAVLVVIIPSGYSLYRSARSLIPLHKFSLDSR